jgi:hypothetical protein
MAQTTTKAPHEDTTADSATTSRNTAEVFVVLYESYKDRSSGCAHKVPLDQLQRSLAENNSSVCPVCGRAIGFVQEANTSDQVVVFKYGKLTYQLGLFQPSSSWWSWWTKPIHIRNRIAQVLHLKEIKVSGYKGSALLL